jgi:hypothetical protein
MRMIGSVEDKWFTVERHLISRSVDVSIVLPVLVHDHSQQVVFSGVD